MIMEHPDRSKYLGSHDTSAIAGIHPWRTPMDVYLEKRGLVEPREATERMQWGLALQPAILARFAEVKGVSLEPERHVQHPTLPWFAGTPDATIAGQRAGVDAKNVEYPRGEWGEPGTDEVPDYILGQCQHFMGLMDYVVWYVAALFGGARLAIYEVERDREFGDMLIDGGGRFWRDHVEAGVEPPVDGSDAAKRFIERKHPRATGDVRPATGEEIELIRRHQALDAEEKRVKDELALVKNRLRQAIGDDRGLAFDGGRVTYGDVKGREGLDRDALAAAHPELVREFTRAGAPSRMLRVPKSKEE